MWGTKIIRRRSLSLAMLAAVALTSVAGCGVKRVPVSGTVTVDGQPINVGQLVFTPDTAKGNTQRIVCVSRIKDGHYDLETNGVTRSDSGTGVPLGWYKVSFRILEDSTKKHQVIAPSINGKFWDPDKTPLSIEVKDDAQPGAYDIKMTK